MHLGAMFIFIFTPCAWDFEGWGGEESLVTNGGTIILPHLLCHQQQKSHHHPKFASQCLCWQGSVWRGGQRPCCKMPLLASSEPAQETKLEFDQHRAQRYADTKLQEPPEFCLLAPSQGAAPHQQAWGQEERARGEGKWSTGGQCVQQQSEPFREFLWGLCPP